MRPIKEQQQETARDLFFQSDLTRSQIAEQVGVSEKTIYLWTKAGDWRKLKSASRLMPSLIVEHFYSQVQELNDNIRNREPGNRFPTVQEAEIFRKLVLTAERLKKKQTRGEYSEMFQKFMQWLLPQNEEHLKLFTNYASAFLTQSAIQGFHPYEIEYGIEEIPPLREDSSESTNVDLEQGDVELSPATEPNQGNLQNTVTPSLLGEKGPGDEPKQEILGTILPVAFEEKSEITRNNSTQSYDLEINNLNDEANEKQEITSQQETGNNKQIPLLRGDSSEEADADSEQGCVPLSKAPASDQGTSIGYLGQKQDIDPNGIKTIEYKPDDTIQKFSIGDAVYYIKKKE
jgi:DNA-binding XRE family transcriptional regulator